MDNDCDGLVDEGAICPSNFVCEHGVCVPDACGVEIPPPEGYVCDPDGDANGVVLLGTCGDVGVCPDGAVCRFGQCAAPCTPGQCAAGSVCGGGACVAGGCYATGCPDGELCRNGACVPDPCLGALCPSGTFCRNGDCVQACAFVSCFTGEKCGVDGFCAPDPCAGRTCGPGERCAAGACVANPCANKGCAQGQVCTVAGDGSAVCVDDPCAGIRCPAGVCAGGQCYATSNPTGAGTIAPGGGGGGEGGCGCGSGSGAGAALPALLGLLLAPLARRRRRPGSGLVLLLVGVALLAGGCKEETPFDPATCQETCGEQRCVDLESDPVYCGGCGAGFACAGGQICVDAVCGPAGAVAPYVKTLSPAAGPVGALVPVTVQLTGERFAAGATVRVVSPAGARTYAATVPDAEHLSVDLDLSGVGPTTWQLRVVNPDKVISNAVTFDVVVPFPAVTAVDPAIVTAGSSTSVLLTGTGFNLTSQCHLRSLLVPEFALPSTVDAAGVHCTVSAETLAPGEYEIWVVNEGNLASNVKQLDIVSQTPTVTGVSPSSGPENATVSLTVSGTGFDPSSRVLFDGCASPADAGCPVDATIVGTSFLTPTTLQAALTLPGCAVTPCSHSISVRNGAGAPTATVPFVVQADTATIATFSTSPAPPYQGDASVTLTFTGTNLSGTIEVQPPAGSFGDVPLTPGAAGPTTVSGTIGLVGRPEGGWLARIAYGGGATSAAWPFRVLSNQAILQDFAASPDPARSGAQGTTKSSVSFQVANVRPLYAGVKVWFRGPAGYAVELDPSPDPTGATGPVTVPNLSLGDLETGTYAFTVKNPNGAAESNALSFSVTPGLPTLSSVSPSSYPLSSPNPVVAVTLTGTNFAKPDANGNGGSVVHILAPALGIPDYAIPAAATTVASRTQIQVQLDVRNGLPGAYDVQIWNPSLPTTVPPAPQKSNTLAGGFTIAP